MASTVRISLLGQEHKVLRLRTPTARRILEDLGTLSYLLERSGGRVKPEESAGDDWDVGVEELASAAFLSRRLGRLLTRLEKRGDVYLSALAEVEEILSPKRDET